MDYIKFDIKINILEHNKITVIATDKRAAELREEWLKKMGQIDSDTLFFAFLVQSPNMSENQTITKTTTSYSIEIDPRDLPDAFKYITKEGE